MNFKNRITSGATQQANGMSRTKSNVNDAVDKIQHESKDIMTNEIYAGADGSSQNEEVNTTPEKQPGCGFQPLGTPLFRVASIPSIQWWTPPPERAP